MKAETQSNTLGAAWFSARRLADHRVHRRRRNRPAVRPLAQLHAAACRGDAAHHRGERILQAGRASGADRRPVRIGVLRRRLGRAPGPGGAGAGRDRLAHPQSRFSVHGCGHHRRNFQPVDDLLPAVGDRREEAAPWRSRPRRMGHGRRRDSDPVPRRRGAGRGRGGVANGGQSSLTSVGEISGALTPVLGEGPGLIVFSAGVLGASLVAAIVSSLALAWGVGEVAGYRRSLEYRPFDAGWFYGVYAACVLGSGAAVWFASNLVSLNTAA